MEDKTWNHYSFGIDPFDMLHNVAPKYLFCHSNISHTRLVLLHVGTVRMHTQCNREYLFHSGSSQWGNQCTFCCRVHFEIVQHHIRHKLYWSRRYFDLSFFYRRSICCILKNQVCCRRRRRKDCTQEDCQWVNMYCVGRIDTLLAVGW